MTTPRAEPLGVEDAAAIIRAGGVVAFPTETVYGLGADATSAAAVQHVYAVKGRPAHNPLIVHVVDEQQARSLCAWCAGAARLAAAFWPGPLTLVLPRAGASLPVPDDVTGGGPTIALRCPASPLALRLIERAGVPLVGPSANRSGRVSPTTAGHVRDEFAGAMPVLDGGACRAGIESTVLSLVGEPAVLRPGVLGAQAIAEALGRPVTPTGHAALPSGGRGEPDEDDAPLASPGLLTSHYAPSTPARLASGDGLAAALADPAAVVLTVRPQAGAAARVLEMPAGAAAYARALYAQLREADALGAGCIVVEAPPGEAADDPADPIWAAVLDRLRRASAGG